MNGEQYIPWGKSAKYYFVPTCNRKICNYVFAQFILFEMFSISCIFSQMFEQNVIMFSQNLFGNAVRHGSTGSSRRKYVHVLKCKACSVNRRSVTWPLRISLSAVKVLAKKWYQGTLLASLGATHVPGQMQVRATLFPTSKWLRHVWETSKNRLGGFEDKWREWMFCA